MGITAVKKLTDENGEYNAKVSLVLKDMPIKWAYLQKPSDMSNKYEVTVELDGKDKDEYIELAKFAWGEYKKSKRLKVAPQSKGYTYVKDEDGNDTDVIKVTPKALYEYEGKTFKPPLVVDKSKNTIDLDNYPLIGNGTVANVKVQIEPYEFNRQHGIRVKLLAVQILELKEYQSQVDLDGFDDFEEDEGDDFTD